MRNYIQLSIKETVARIEYEKNLLKAQCSLLKNNIQEKVTSPKNYLLVLLAGFIMKKWMLSKKATGYSLPFLLENFSKKSRFKSFFKFASNIYSILLFLPLFKKLFSSSRKE